MGTSAGVARAPRQALHGPLQGPLHGHLLLRALFGLRRPLPLDSDFVVLQPDLGVVGCTASQHAK
eukprot:14617255-Alexandrium_andersonii.AAC.1